MFLLRGERQEEESVGERHMERKVDYEEDLHVYDNLDDHSDKISGFVPDPQEENCIEPHE